ncbi:MAG TPA: Ig-like domain-containing protein [Gemmatimonadaceae bacterium]|nr:Ig-like domain-containing protein [Gemmatimonadaceae bacterium]
MRPHLGFVRVLQSRSRQIAALLALGLAFACKGSSSPSVVIGSVSVTPSTATRIPGETVQLTAAAMSPAGDVIAGQTFDWSTSNASVASVDENGLVTALTVGAAMITAEVGGKQGTASITVGVPVSTITLTPEADTLGVGKTLQLNVQLADANGGPVTGRTVNYSTSAVNVVSVTPAGLITALAIGTTTITGTIDGKTDAVNIEVVDACSTLLSTRIVLGDTHQGTLEATDCTLNDGTVVDGYRLETTSAVDVQIDLVSTAFDAFIILLEETATDLVEVGFDDDGGGGTNARMLITLDAGKIYHILANNFDPGVMGPYTLSLLDASLVAGARDIAPTRATKGRAKRPFAELWPIR